jgi:hypothetical protein
LAFEKHSFTKGKDLVTENEEVRKILHLTGALLFYLIFAAKFDTKQ